MPTMDNITKVELHPQSLCTISESGRRPGLAIWITGMPGAGKSTTARILQRRLAESGEVSVILDSDEVRGAVFPFLGYVPEDRMRAYSGLIGMASLLSSQGNIVLVPATTSTEAARREARARCPRFVEVHINTPRQECVERDPKGHYAAGRINFEMELPEAPEFELRGADDDDGIARVLARALRLRRGEE